MIDTLYQHLYFWLKYAVNWFGHLRPAEFVLMVLMAAILGSAWKAKRGDHRTR